MEADARIVWNPYYTISTTDGFYAIGNIPAGKYKVTAWHPYIGEISQEITVTEGANSQTNFTLERQ